MKKQNEKITDLIFGIILIVFVAFYYCCNSWIPGIAGDGGDGHYAIWAANAKMLHDGEIPLWNPYIWGGYGDVGHIHGVFYPILLLLEYLFWNSTTQTLSYAIFPAYIAIHIIIFSLGMYFLCKKLNKRAITAFVIAMLTAFTGCLTSIAEWAYISGGVYWIPWLLFCLYSLIKSEKKSWIAITGLVLGMIALGASAQGALFAVLVYVIVFGFAIWNERKEVKKVVKITIRLLGSGFIGMALASVELIPFLETTINAFRYVNGMDIFDTTQKIPLSYLKVDVIDKNSIMQFFGAYCGFFAVNVALLFLIILGFFIRKKHDEQWFINSQKFLFFFSMFYSIGFGVIDIMWYIPGFNAIREPILYAPFMVIAGGVLAADALEVILTVWDNENKSKLPDFLQNDNLCYLLLIATGIIVCLPHNIKGTTDIILKGIVLILVMLLIFRKKVNRYAVALFLFAIVTVNYIAFCDANVKYTNYSLEAASHKVDETNQLASELFDEIDGNVIDGTDSTARYLIWSPEGVLPANIAGIVGQKDCFAYLNPIYEKNYFNYQFTELIKRVQLQNIKYILLADDNEDIFIEWLGSEIGKESVLCYTEVYDSYDSNETKKIRYIDTSDINLGCGWVVNDYLEYKASDVSGAKKSSEFLSNINDMEFDLSVKAYINADTMTNTQKWNLEDDQNVEYEVICIEDTANKMEYEVNTDSEGVFVTTEFYYPGWHVVVDGQKQELLEVNYAFRGVYLSAGNHTVEFYYMPVSFIIGIMLCILAIIIISICVWFDYKDIKNMSRE